MGVDRAERSIEIDAPARACWDAILDFESYPDWQSAVKDVEVMERDDEGRGRDVEFQIDAKVRQIETALKEFKEIEAESPECYVSKNGRFPVIDSGRNAAGDTVITTGDGKGTLVRYTFTE